MTTTLMTYAGTTGPDAPTTRTGGAPLAPAGTTWPQCATCDGPMLVVQLKEGRDHATAMNFGGRGESYAFACEPCAHAVFLRQC
ncbi:hypothetical protein ACFV6D_35110 [Kitasatospora sp. NPDC059812]|uniref:hypothetical protein n=1 Tax=Kitasatospora sp. NPDC059812 TaxID=3346958 RepID=UPI0036699753